MVVGYCNSFAPKDGNPTQSPSFKKTLKEYHWPSSKIKPCPKPMAQWLESFLEEHEL